MRLAPNGMKWTRPNLVDNNAAAALSQEMINLHAVLREIKRNKCFQTPIRIKEPLVFDLAGPAPIGCPAEGDFDVGSAKRRPGVSQSSHQFSLLRGGGSDRASQNKIGYRAPSTGTSLTRLIIISQSLTQSTREASGFLARTLPERVM